MKQNKTAKDLAFDRERARLKHQIDKLKEEIRQYKNDIDCLESINEFHEERIKDYQKENAELKNLLKMRNIDASEYIKEFMHKAEIDKKGIEAINSLMALKSMF